MKDWKGKRVFQFNFINFYFCSNQRWSSGRRGMNTISRLLHAPSRKAEVTFTSRATNQSLCTFGRTNSVNFFFLIGTKKCAKVLKTEKVKKKVLSMTWANSAVLNWNVGVTQKCNWWNKLAFYDYYYLNCIFYRSKSYCIVYLCNSFVLLFSARLPASVLMQRVSVVIEQQPGRCLRWTLLSGR